MRKKIKSLTFTIVSLVTVILIGAFDKWERYRNDGKYPWLLRFKKSIHRFEESTVAISLNFDVKLYCVNLINLIARKRKTQLIPQVAY